MRITVQDSNGLFSQYYLSIIVNDGPNLGPPKFVVDLLTTTTKIPLGFEWVYYLPTIMDPDISDVNPLVTLKIPAFLE